MKVLFAGKSWILTLMQEGYTRVSIGIAGEAVSIGVRPADTATTHHERIPEVDGVLLLQSLERTGHEVTYLPAAVVPSDFPLDADALADWDVLVLSDCSADTLRRVIGSEPDRAVNRLEAIRSYVLKGGGLLMFGGFASFAGKDNLGGFAGTPVEDVLPVLVGTSDDRVVTSEGESPSVAAPGHPALTGLSEDWPPLNGHNRFRAKTSADVLLLSGEDPLLVTWQVGQGRAAAFGSDCAPYWASTQFMNWAGYDVFWSNLVRWLSKDL